MCSWLVLAFKGVSGNIGCSSGAMQSSGKACIATSYPNQPNWSRCHAVHEWMRNLRVRHGWPHTSREHWVTNMLSVMCSRLALGFKGASDDTYAHMHICTYAHKNADTQAQAHAHMHAHTHTVHMPQQTIMHIPSVMATYIARRQSLERNYRHVFMVGLGVQRGLW
jgi:hypothetical protein